MNLDVKTLFTVVTLAYLIGAVVMTVLSIAMRSAPKSVRAGWGLWGICLFLSAAAATMISQRGAIPDALSIIVANALLTIGFGLRPSAIALLNGSKMHYLWLPVAGTLGWLGLYAFEFFRSDILLRVIYINGFCLLGVLLCVRESMRLNLHRVSSWFLTIAFSMDVAVRISLIGTHLQKHYPTLLEAYETLPLQLCFLALITAIVLKLVGITVSIFEMQRHQYREEAEKDPQTGLLNQRGFMRTASRHHEQLAPSSAPYALVLMDIDELKQIEERYGATMRDALQKLFGKIAGSTLPSTAVAGHLPTGQIVVFMPLSDGVEANSYARRISKMLVTESQSASGNRVAARLSAGIFTGTADTDIQRAIEIAGICLRQARQDNHSNIMTHHAATGNPVAATSDETPFARRQKQEVLDPAQ
ncbi:GGDEF domain-containing protein [Roseibium alexandrii]|uniref:GGDEF domain-containing protein n=1 Tax=Roseibium alexandrii TaxID=388408 RepID=UPI0037517465